MALKNILVHVDASERAGERVEIAAALAQSSDAHLTGLYVVPDPTTYLVDYVPARVFSEQIEEAARRIEDGRERVPPHRGKQGRPRRMAQRGRPAQRDRGPPRPATPTSRRSGRATSTTPSGIRTPNSPPTW